MRYNRVLIKDGIIVNEGRSFRGSLFIVGDTIADITDSSSDVESYLAQADEVVDVSGMYVMPGVIDTHVHFREPGGESKGTIFSESRAAALGGVTSYMDMPNNNPASVTLEAVEHKFDIAASDSAVNYSFYLGASNTNLEEVLSADVSRICAIKLFMGSSTGNMLVDDRSMLEHLFEKVVGMPLAVHCEDEKIIRDNLLSFKERYGDDVPVESHPLIRSRKACVESTRKALELALRYGTRLHVCHVSCAEEVGMISDCRASGGFISSETCVHYIVFCDEDYALYGNRIKCNPAIKSRSDMEALRLAVFDGKIDSVVTDHAPHLLAEKERPYLWAPSGIPSVQTSLVSMLGLMPVEKVVEAMCHAPARIFDVYHRGYLRPGYFADVVVVDPSHGCTITPAYKCGWAPVLDFNCTLRHTFVNGIHTVADSALTGQFDARALRFSR